MTDARKDLQDRIYDARIKRSALLTGAAGASIAFALLQVKEIKLNGETLPLLVALIFWALSYWKGVNVYKNLIKESLENIWLMYFMAQGNVEKELLIAMNKNLKQIQDDHFSKEHSQARLMLWGAAAFVLWYVFKGFEHSALREPLSSAFW